MNLIKGAIPFFSLPFIISLLTIPLVKKIGYYLGIYALENNRTVHKGKIVRIGGVSIFLAFYFSMAFFLKADRILNGILLGGIIIFTVGLIDDAINISAKYKLLGQLIAALCAVFIGGIEISGFEFLNHTFLAAYVDYFKIFVSIIWIVGVSNAVNLIDGLDGLCGGISFIVVCIIGLLGFFLGRRDIVLISLMLIGSIGGFIPYNFNPASIFMGDCGALFLGYIISCISLLGFKTSTFVTLGFPIIILFIPLSDTMLAIIRRKAKGVKISEADKSHLHHILMFKIGLSHKWTVIVLYCVTILFGLSAIITFFNQKLGIVFLAILCFISWIFIELTGMIRNDFHPLIGLSRRVLKFPKKSKDAFFEANKLH